MTPEECLVIYGEAWFERDSIRRVEILRRCCTEDIVFMDPMLGRLEGLDAVSNMIGGYIGSRMGYRFMSKRSQLLAQPPS